MIKSVPVSEQYELTAIEDERSPLSDDHMIIRRNILHNGSDLAHLDLEYSTQDHTVVIETVGILNDANRNRGFGKKIYEIVNTLPTPDGEKYTFISTGQSIEARRVWESFVRAKKAIKHTDGSYEMLESEEQ